MSRLARKAIVIPQGVQLEQKDNDLVVKGPNGNFVHKLHSTVKLNLNEQEVTVARTNESKLAKSVQGTTFVLINNYITGVTKGFAKKLILKGVGYRAKLAGKQLELTLGFSHPVKYLAPEGITIEVPEVTEVVVKGADKQQVGQVAAEIRKLRPIEPYKGKGVRYADEMVILKETKKK